MEYTIDMLCRVKHPVRAGIMITGQQELKRKITGLGFSTTKGKVAELLNSPSTFERKKTNNSTESASYIQKSVLEEIVKLMNSGNAVSLKKTSKHAA